MNPQIDLSPLIQTGALGAVCAWFMWITVGELRMLRLSMDRMARSVLMLIVEFSDAPPSAKREAERMVAEIDEANTIKK